MNYDHKALDRVFNEIYNPKGEYVQIIKNIFKSNGELPTQQRVSELLSEISTYWMNDPEKILKIYNSGRLKWYFTTTVKFQIKSSNSYYNKNCRNNGTYNPKLTNSLDSQEDDYLNSPYDNTEIEDKLLFEDRLQQVTDILNNPRLGITLYNIIWFKMYYLEDKTFSEIAKEFNVSSSTIFYSVDKVRKLLKQFLAPETLPPLKKSM